MNKNTIIGVSNKIQPITPITQRNKELTEWLNGGERAPYEAQLSKKQKPHSEKPVTTNVTTSIEIYKPNRADVERERCAKGMKETRKKFRFTCDMVHLTFAGHLDYDELIEHFRKFCKSGYKWYSVVHETGHTKTNESTSTTSTTIPRNTDTLDSGASTSTESDANGDIRGLGILRRERDKSPERAWVKDSVERYNDDNVTNLEGYKHTHFACGWQKRIDRAGERPFDYNGIHPNVKRITTLEQAQNTYAYHQKDGTPKQSENTPLISTNFYDRIKNSRTLGEACELAGVTIRTVADVQLIRHDIAKRGPYTHSHPDSIWILEKVWTRVLVLWGDTGTGKTQWAVHQFNNPLVVSHMDTLRRFGPEHDG